MDIVSDNYNQPAGVRISLEPPPIQDTGPVIQAWSPIEQQHKIQLNTPIVTSHIPAPVLDVYISVNPNINKYIKYNDQTLETSIINNDFTINEYINQQNKNMWNDKNDITHKIIDNRQMKPGQVQFLKGSHQPQENAHKTSETLPKQHSYFYRGYINHPHSEQLQSHNSHSIQQIQKTDEPLKSNNYSMQQVQTSYNDGIRRDYQKYIWQGQDINKKKTWNSTDKAWYKSNQHEQNSKTNNLENLFFGDTPGSQHQQYSQNISLYKKYNSLNTKLQDVRRGETKSDEVLLKINHADSHMLSLPMNDLKLDKTPKEIPEIHAIPLHRPSLKNNKTRPKEHTLFHEEKQTVKHAQDIIDQPEVYPDLKVKKKLKLKKKKLGTLEKVFVEQKNLDDLVEQRDDLSQEIWEQNFMNLGKERYIGQGHEKKSNSKEQSEEVPSMWDQNINQEKGNPIGTQWHNYLEHLNMSLQNLENHKQSVEEYIYANTGSIFLYDNNAKKQTKNFSRTATKKKAGDTRAIEIAYLKEIQSKTEPPPPQEVEKPQVVEKPPERKHSPLWNAMESYYTFAKDIIVSWFD